jgi:hypothetical protein
MIVIDEKFLVIKEINGYLVDMILINSIRSGLVLYPKIYRTTRSSAEKSIFCKAAAAAHPTGNIDQNHIY